MEIQISDLNIQILDSDMHLDVHIHIASSAGIRALHLVTEGWLVMLVEMGLVCCAQCHPSG